MEDDSSSMPPSELFSSQNAHSEAFPSSPPSLPSRSNKPKRAPTITPRRFNRFFQPSSSRHHSSPIIHSASARALKALTAGAVNSRQGSEQGHIEFEDFPEPRPVKRRKLFVTGNAATHLDYDSDAIIEPSSPIRSSPCRRSPLKSSYVPRVERAREAAPYIRARQPKVVADHRYSTEAFCSQPEDVHSYATTAPHALPFCVASCNTNTLIALGDEDGHIRIVETAKGGKASLDTPLLSFKPHNNAVMGVSFSSDDRWLATASGDQSAKVIDMFTQKTVYTLTGHTSSVKQASFQPGNDNILATCSRDGAINLWDVRCVGRAAAVSTTISSDIADMAIRPPVSNSIRHAHRADIDYPLKAEFLSPAVTSMTFLDAKRPHLLLTSCDASARLRLWDIRARHSTTSRKPCPVPLATTPHPLTHYTGAMLRTKGISSVALSTDASRFYAVCKDNIVYAYSTNHLILGQAPELAALDVSGKQRPWRMDRERDAMAPLFGMRNEAMKVNSFYVRSAVRRRTPENEELLAIGSSAGTPVIYCTEEARLGKMSNAGDGQLPIYQTGTALLRGHDAEVTGVSWTSEGSMLSVADDYTARVWREDRDKASKLRVGGEGEGRRWGCGWADMGTEDWDDSEG